MKSSILGFLIAASAALAMQGAAAADAPAKASSRPAAAAKRSMAEKGSFHQVHARKAKTDCEDCHSNEPFAPDVLLVSRNRPLAKGSPGPVDPKECYDCHWQKSNKLPLYAPR